MINSTFKRVFLGSVEELRCGCQLYAAVVRRVDPLVPGECRIQGG
jgi:hypothetical protein